MIRVDGWRAARNRWLAVCLVAAVLCLIACGGQVPRATSRPLPSTTESNHATNGSLAPDATPIRDERSDQIRLIATLAKPDHSADFANSDLAFWDDLVVQGSYDGFRLIDISEPEAPRLLADVACRGPQGDVSIWEGLVFVSVDRPQTGATCDSIDAMDAEPLAVPAAGAWEGIRIFDVSDPTSPRSVGSVATDCGSHTHTLVPDLDRARVLLYVTSQCIRRDIKQDAPECANPHGHISIVEVPLDDPGAARVVAQPKLVDTPAFEIPDAPPDAEATVGCHDIGVYLERKLAAAACMSEGQIWDISDPVLPRTLAHIDRPEVVFWHSATWSDDGSVVAFGDENLAPNGCADKPAGAIWFYDVRGPDEPTASGQFSLDRPQPGEICSAHMFNVIPGIDRDILVGGFYAGGTTIVDFTDPSKAREIAYYKVGGASPGDQWAAYWYQGLVVASDHHRGLDIFTADLPEAAGATRLTHLDPQTQE